MEALPEEFADSWARLEGLGPTARGSVVRILVEDFSSGTKIHYQAPPKDKEGVEMRRASWEISDAGVLM